MILSVTFTRPTAAALAAIALVAVPAGVAAEAPQSPEAPQPPEPEVLPGPPLAVPAVPILELPPGEPGVRSVRERRVHGSHDGLGTELTVKGYVTWIHDCARAGEDPTRCERSKLYLGATKDAPPERSIWVVDVPRPPTRRERLALPQAELAKWPAVPSFALGDHVAVTGTWAIQSPHGEHNFDGLLVFKSLQPAAPVTAAAAAAAAASPRPAPPASPRPVVMMPQPPYPGERAPAGPMSRRESILAASEGARALAADDLDEALHHYQASLSRWRGNHAAAYSLAGVYLQKQQWEHAVRAAMRAAAFALDVAMYRLMIGRCLYERAVQQARAAQAAAQGQPPELITPDLRAVDQSGALDQLAYALHLNGGLWRAHDYLGRIYRDRGDDAGAAAAFTEAVRSGPAEAAPYVALAALYLRWDHADEAIHVAGLGAATVTPTARADVLYMLGRAHERKRQDAAAAAAYTKALAARPDLAPALFMRAQVYLRLKKPAAAKADLEAFLDHPEARGPERSIALRQLADLARGRP